MPVSFSEGETGKVLIWMGREMERNWEEQEKEKGKP